MASDCDLELAETNLWAPAEVESHDLVSVELDLTERQYKIINRPFTPNELLIVRAGPGSGKTFTLTARIARQIQNGFLPDEILVLSMANRSVAAIRRSLAYLLDSETVLKIDVSTFHSFCGSILEQHEAGKRRIIDSQSWTRVANVFLSGSISFRDSHLKRKVPYTALQKAMSAVKDGSLGIAAASAKFKVDQKFLTDLLDFLAGHGMCTYGDIIANALMLMRHKRDDPRLMRYKVVIVDEFQDMYPQLQSVIESVLAYPAEKPRHLMVTGDPNQSIYGFLGSSRDNFKSVKERLSGMSAALVPMRESFRCSSKILAAATAVCIPHQKQPPVSIKEHLCDHKPVFTAHKSRDSEVDFVSREILRLICTLGGLIKPHDIAVLARANADAETIQMHLKSSFGIKSHKVLQSNAWVKGKLLVFKDILSVASSDRDSSFSLFCLLNMLAESKEAKACLTKMFSAALCSQLSSDLFFQEYLATARCDNAELRQLIKLIQHLGPSPDQTPQEVVDFLARCFENNHFLQLLEGEGIPTSELGLFNRSLHHAYEQYSLNSEARERLTFLHYFLRTYDNEVPVKEENSVHVSTIHAAKGLEYPVVFVLGWGRFPHWKKVFGQKTQSEETRLLYVGMTRARELLYVGSCEAIERPLCFTVNTPILDRPFIQKLATALGRPEPPQEKLSRGAALYLGWQAKALSGMRAVARLVR